MNSLEPQAVIALELWHPQATLKHSSPSAGSPETETRRKTETQTRKEAFQLLVLPLCLWPLLELANETLGTGRLAPCGHRLFSTRLQIVYKEQDETFPGSLDMHEKASSYGSTTLGGSAQPCIEKGLSCNLAASKGFPKGA